MCTRQVCVFPLLAKWESLNDVGQYLSILWLNWHIYSLSTTYGHTIAMAAKLSAADRRDMNLHTYKDRHSAFMKMVERQKELEEEQQRRRGDSFYNSYSQPIRAMSSPTPNRRIGKVRHEPDGNSVKGFERLFKLVNTYDWLFFKLYLYVSMWSCSMQGISSMLVWQELIEHDIHCRWTVCKLKQAKWTPPQRTDFV